MEDEEKLKQHAVPVVEFWDNVIGAPIVGTLDSQRTQVLMESLLSELSDKNARVIVLDISGVPTVDTEVSKHLLSLAEAIDLMGSTCIISGVRPDVAQTVVNLGIDFTSVITTPALSQALERALKEVGLSVVKQTEEYVS